MKSMPCKECQRTTASWNGLGEWEYSAAPGKNPRFSHALRRSIRREEQAPVRARMAHFHDYRHLSLDCYTELGDLLTAGLDLEEGSR